MSARIESITDGYIAAALWADCMPACGCDHGECGCESGGLERLTPTAESYAYVRALVAAFVDAAGDDLDTFVELRERTGPDPWESVGHDLRLSSGGHGTGFWDREPDRALRERADAFVLARYGAARARLHALAYDDRRFTRIGGGDVWQLDDDHAQFDPIAFHADAAPGDRWTAPAFALTEDGLVPIPADVDRHHEDCDYRVSRTCGEAFPCNLGCETESR